MYMSFLLSFIKFLSLLSSKLIDILALMRRVYLKKMLK